MTSHYLLLAFFVALVGNVITPAVAADDTDMAVIKEQLKMVSIKLQALTTRHSLELQQLTKEIQELKTNAAIGNSNNGGQRNEQLTLEWAKNALGELRGEMKEVEASNNASERRQEHQQLRNEVSAAKAEAEGVSRVLQQTTTRLASVEAKLAEQTLDIQHARRLCFNVKNELKFAQTEWKTNFKTLMKGPPNHIEEREKLQKESPEAHRFRHLHMLRKQMQEMIRAHRKLSVAQENMNDQLIDIQARMESVNSVNAIADPNIRIEDILDEQQRQAATLQNISGDVNNFNKLHISMLELLENMESLESKVDKTIPDFQKEISRLDINITQANSHFEYMKEDQETIRQSVKAIAVSVSNTVDKVDQDRQLLLRINDTVQHLSHQSKQHYYRLSDHISKTEASQAHNYSSPSDDMPSLMGELQELKDVQDEFENIVSHLPTSCHSVEGPPGNYLIAPGPGSPIQTACEDGSTLIQRRMNGSVDFNRNYKEYAAGFGSPSGEFWIGNDAIYRLTTDNCSSLRIEMVDIYGKPWVAAYSNFQVESAANGYRLNVDGFSGNASDALEYQNHMEFSTIDNDRDISNTHCAANYEGGWWFSHCQHANLNGKYTLGLTWFDGMHNDWIAIASSKITLHKRPGCF